MWHKLKTAALAAGILLLMAAEEPAKVEFHGWYSNPVFSADGKTLVYVRLQALGPDSRTAPTQIILWDVAAAKERRRIDGPADDSLIGPVVISPDGKKLAIGMWNTAVRLWDLDGGKELRRFENSNGAMNVRFSPDGGTVGWLKNDEIHLADAATGKVVQHFGKEERTRLGNLAFGNGGKTVFSGHTKSTDVSGPGAGKNRTFEYQTTYWAREADGGKKLYQIGEKVTDTRRMFGGPPVHDLFVSADGKTVVLMGESGNIQICDEATGRRTRTVPVPWKVPADDPLRRLALSANGKVLASVSARGVIAVWDLAGGRELRRIETGQTIVEQLALSPDGKTLAVTHQTPGRVGAVLLIYRL
jgi:WD40 repeat protein